MCDGDDSLLIRAACGEAVERVPVWLMRQAGRYLSEYREVRSKHGFLEVCSTPELACEVSLQPYRAFPLDAVIMFADILTPLAGMGIPFTLDEGGPRITGPITTAADLARVRVADPTESVPFVLELIRLLKREVTEVAVLGFAGAPWTLGTYAAGSGRHRKESALRTMALEDPKTAHQLLGRLADQQAAYLAAQVEAGVDAVQLFDTWAGELGEQDYRELALPYQQRAIASVRGRVPVILYVLGQTDPRLLAESGADVLSLDWRLPIARARAALGAEVTLQGNLDPALLLGPPQTVCERSRQILAEAGGRRHLFNLGHGLLPSTRRECVAALVETVRDWRP